MQRRLLQSFRQFLLDRMVLRPSRYPLDHPSQQRVMLRCCGRPLECFVQRNCDAGEPLDLLVLKFPGTAGRAERSTAFPASVLSDIRVAVWTWNPPGYGRSGGRASLQRIADAAAEFWTQVTLQEAGESTSIWLCGNSLGCATALHVAASAQPDPSRVGVILRNPPPLIPVVKRIARQYPLGGLLDSTIESLCEPMNALLTARQVDLPAVILQSELDSLVPLSHQNQVVDAYAGPLQNVLMEGLEHGCIPTELHEPLIRASIEWLWEQTGCKSDEPNRTS